MTIPRIEDLTLEGPINLEFIYLFQQMVIIFLPQFLTNLGLKINIPNHTKEGKFSVRVFPLNKKRKTSAIEKTSNPKGREKRLL